MEIFYIVYVTTNNLNGKFYIGSHSCRSLDDGYLGSGKLIKLALRKYGRENFSRHVVSMCPSLSEARELEELLVQEAISRKGRLCYNRSWSGTGAVLGEGNAFYGKTHSEETKKKISSSASSRTGSKNPFFGKNHSLESLAKMKETKKANPVSSDILARAQSKWLWHTPAGTFYSCYDAAAANNLGYNCIKNWCKNSDKYVSPHYQIPEKYWGRTWKENGFYRQRHGEA